MDLRIAIAQTNPRLGDLHANLEEHLRVVDEARAGGAELVLFPELSLTGYFLKDQVHELGLRRDDALLGPLAERSRDVSIAFGFVERTRDERFYNALAFLEDGALVGVHRKVHLVTYGMFDEARDFAAGESFTPIRSKHGLLGPLICEDLWHVPSAYLYFLDGVDLLAVASAPPLRGVEPPGPGLGSQRTWETLLTSTAVLHRTWVAYAGRVGWEDGIGFGGGSMLLDPFGERRASAAGFEPALVEAHLEEAALRRARVETPLRRDEKPWILAAELERRLRAPGAEDGR